MRWSIRQQVLIPIVAIQTVAVVAITMASVALAARRTERQIVDRLNGVVDALGRSNFPLTEGILERMHSLSGAEFITYESWRCSGGRQFIGTGRQCSTARTCGRSRSREDRCAERFTVDRLERTEPLCRVDRLPTSPSAGALLVLYPESSWREARWESAQAPLILGIGALALMAAATTWIAHRISGGIHRLEHQVARIAEGDFRELEFGPNVPQDEVQDLARSINRMCGQLRQMSQTIRQTERTHLLAQLAAGLAHQLRNALTGARMSIQLHEKRCQSARSDPSMNVALRQLGLDRGAGARPADAGAGGRSDSRLFDLVGLVHDVASLLEPACEHSRVGLEVDPGPSAVTAVVDEPSLRAAVLNLALNAIEAAGPGGAVGIAVRSIAGRADDPGQ